MNATWRLTDDYRPRTALGPGERVEVQFEAEDLANSWALFVYSAVEDKRFVWVEWMPLAYGSELAVGPPANPNNAARVKRPRVSIRPVGPGAATRVLIRRSGKWADYVNQLNLALSLLPTKPSVWAAGTFLPQGADREGPISGAGGL